MQNYAVEHRSSSKGVSNPFVWEKLEENMINLKKKTNLLQSIDQEEYQGHEKKDGATTKDYFCIYNNETQMQIMI